MQSRAELYDEFGQPEKLCYKENLWTFINGVGQETLTSTYEIALLITVKALSRTFIAAGRLWQKAAYCNSNCIGRGGKTKKIASEESRLFFKMEPDDDSPN